MADERGNGPQDWAEWLTWLNYNTDPLAIQRVLEQSAQAFEQSATTQQAIARIAEAMAAEATRCHEQGHALAETLQTWANRLAGHQPPPPPLGPFPRQQTLLNALNQQSEAYQHALVAHLESVTTLAERCTEAFRETLQAEGDAANDQTLEPEELLERWSAVAEPIYEDWLDQPDTQRRIAALTNAWSALVNSLSALLDRYLETLGLPSRRAIDDLAAELQRQRRRQREAINALRAEVATLREQQQSHEPS